jgi:hypothetical protein
MKNTGYAFEIPQSLLDFFYPAPPEGEYILLKDLIKTSKRKHNSLCHRYFNIIETSNSHLYFQLKLVYKEYEKLLYHVNELLFLGYQSDAILLLRKVSAIVEETALAIWYKLCEAQDEHDRMFYKKQGESFLPRDGSNRSTDDDEDEWEEA